VKQTTQGLIEQHALDVFAGDEAHDDGGQERHQHADHEAARIGIAREHADRDIPQLLEIEPDDREDRTKLDQNRK